MPYRDFPGLSNDNFAIGEAVAAGNTIVNFGFVGGDGLPLGSEVLLHKGCDGGLGNSKLCDSAPIAWLKA